MCGALTMGETILFGGIRMYRYAGSIPAATQIDMEWHCATGGGGEYNLYIYACLFLLVGGLMVYHYTIFQRYIQIREARLLLPAVAGIDPGERGAVWFSREDRYPFSAAKSIIEGGEVVFLTPSEMVENGMTLVRIQFPFSVAPYSWRQWRNKSRVSPDTARGLYESATENGDDPALWRVSFRPVRLDRAWRVEVYRLNDPVWRELSL